MTEPDLFKGFQSSLEIIRLAVDAKGAVSFPPQKNAEGLVLSIYFAVNSVGVFLRGPRGTTPSEIAAVFNPKAEKFRELVGGEMKDATESDHPACYKRMNMRDRKNWPEAIDWLKQKSDLWLAAVDELFSEDIGQ
jgi:hypothetical protein